MPEGRGARLGFLERRCVCVCKQELGRAEAALRLAGITEVLNGWTFCRGVFRSWSVLAEKCVLPKCWGLDIVGLGPYLPLGEAEPVHVHLQWHWHLL